MTLMQDQLAELFHSEHRDVEEKHLRKEIAENIKHPHADFTGAASIGKNPEINMYMRATGPNTEGHPIFECPPDAPDYKETMLHYGPSKAGEQ